MKILSSLFGFGFAVLMLGGCSTPQSVSKMHGKGSRQTYDAAYERVWTAAVAAAQQGDLQILNADKDHGYISTKRGLQPKTFGENVGVWVRKVSDNKTEVEVVSRQAGPPVLELRNWEHRILNSISANLTTE